jgi:hypothetical protein
MLIWIRSCGIIKIIKLNVKLNVWETLMLDCLVFFMWFVHVNKQTCQKHVVTIESWDRDSLQVYS